MTFIGFHPSVLFAIGNRDSLRGAKNSAETWSSVTSERDYSSPGFILNSVLDVQNWIQTENENGIL